MARHCTGNIPNASRLARSCGNVINRGEASSVLFVKRNAIGSTWQLDRLREVLRSAKEVTVVELASCGPYDLLAVPASASATRDEASFERLDKVGYVASFEMTADALHAAAAVIFGEEEAKRVPVCGGKLCTILCIGIAILS